MAEEQSVAVVTGPITGRIPTPDPAVKADMVNVTPDVLYFDTVEEAQAVAAAIETEHAIRGTHPIQLECGHLLDPEFFPDGADPERLADHQAAHAALNQAQGL